MKVSLVFLAILAVCTGFPSSFVKEGGVGMKIADKEFLMKQKFIFDVLYNLHMPLGEEYMKDVKGFVEGKEYYINYDYVLKFLMTYKYGLLPRDYVFSVFNYRHVTELKGLFYLFYYSRDWTTFYRNVLWARFNVNEGMFVYALYAAVLHRPDMKNIILPAHYEVLPYMYFNGLTIDEILKFKPLGTSKLDKDVIILSKYTDDILMMNEESKLAYFTEDIGWNMFYFFFNMDYPYWLGGKDFGLFKDRRGEQFLYMHQQLIARYYLERLSHGLGEIPEFSWYKGIKTGYNPQMKYFNGLPFSVRKNYYEIFTTGDYYGLNRIEDFERRIRYVIDMGYFETLTGGKVDLWSKEGIDILGNLIQSNPDSISEQFFGKLIIYAHKMLSGGKFDEIYNYKIVPGVLEHYETMLRDPVFYQFYKRILKFFFQYKMNLPAYKAEDLFLPGVKINKVEISKLVTYFDYFDSDVSTLLEFDIKGYEGKYTGMDKDFYYNNKHMFTDNKYMDTDFYKKDYGMDYMKKDYMGSDYLNKDYFFKNDFYDKNYGMDYMKKDYMGADYFNKDYFFKNNFYDKNYGVDYMKKGYMGSDYLNKDYFNYDKTKFYGMDYYKKDYNTMPYGYQYVMNKDYPYSKDYIYNKDYLLNKDYSTNKDYMFDKDYVMKNDYYTDKDLMLNKDYMFKKDYIMDKDYFMDKDFTFQKAKFMNFDYKFKVRQWRLNHKPFTFNLEVSADKPQTVVFRVYMGPKYDYMGKLININENRENFVEFDQFLFNLKTGLNQIHRESREFYFSVKDRTMYTDLYKMVMMGLEGKFEFPLDMSEAHNGFPDRLLLPKGWVSGMPMQFFFIITPYKGTQQYSNYKFWFTSGVGSGLRFIDDLPFGYPFDRFIDESDFYTPNMYFKDAFIYHMDDMHKFSDINMDKMDMYNTKDLYYNQMESGSYFKYPWTMNKMETMPWQYSDVMQKKMFYK